MKISVFLVALTLSAIAHAEDYKCQEQLNQDLNNAKIFGSIDHPSGDKEILSFEKQRAAAADAVKQYFAEKTKLSQTQEAIKKDAAKYGCADVTSVFGTTDGFNHNYEFDRCFTAQEAQSYARTQDRKDKAWHDADLLGESAGNDLKAKYSRLSRFEEYLDHNARDRVKSLASHFLAWHKQEDPEEDKVRVLFKYMEGKMAQVGGMSFPNTEAGLMSDIQKFPDLKITIVGKIPPTSPQIAEQAAAEKIQKEINAFDIAHAKEAEAHRKYEDATENLPKAQLEDTKAYLQRVIDQNKAGYEAYEKVQPTWHDLDEKLNKVTNGIIFGSHENPVLKVNVIDGRIQEYSMNDGKNGQLKVELESDCSVKYVYSGNSGSDQVYCKTHKSDKICIQYFSKPQQVKATNEGPPSAR